MSDVVEASETGATRLAIDEPSLVGVFDLFSNAPNGAAKIRELILTLGGRGALGSGAVRAPTRRLGAIAEFVMGQAPPGNTCNTDGRGTVFVKTGEFGPVFPVVREWTDHPLKYARHGDVLICVVGATIGKLNLAIDCAIGRSVAAIRPDESLDTKYLYYMLMPYTLSLRRGSRGSAQGVIGRSELSAISIRVPPLAEQHQIVDRVEELMKLCDALEQRGRLTDEQHARLTSTLFDALAASESAHALAENWRRVSELFDLLLDRREAIDALEQSILELAVRGLLVPQHSFDQPANELLASIRAEKELTPNGRRINREPLSQVVGEKAQPFDLPTGWEWARFPEVGEFGRGKSKHRPRNDPSLFDPGIYPLIQTGEVSRAGKFITEVHSYYSEVGLAQSRLWPAGTLCITIAANIADSAILSFDACFPDSVVGFIPARGLEDARYFLIFMKTARQRLVDFAPATAQKNINLDVLNSVLIPLPPAAEQRRIVSRVEELQRLCADLRQRLTQARTTQARLADALVAEVA